MFTTELAEQVTKSLNNAGVSVDLKTVEGRLKILLEEFKVPENEAVRSVTNYFAKELDVPREKLFVAPIAKIADLSRPDQWVSLKVRVVQLWKSSSQNISQAGLIGDSTGIIKFVVWRDAGLKEVDEGKCYLLENVVTDHYNDRVQINITNRSTIKPIDEDIPLPQEEIRGALVAIQHNSGLIQRCPHCGAVVNKSICTIHGKVEGYDDLRLKGVLDDGVNVHSVILDRSVIKSLTNIGVEEARTIASRTLDRSIVLQRLKKKLLGRYLCLKGFDGKYFLVKKAYFLNSCNFH